MASAKRCTTSTATRVALGPDIGFIVALSRGRSVRTDDSYLHLLNDLQRDPFFILGCHRSGTTFVYQSLVATRQFDFVSPYDIVHYDSLLHLRVTGGEAGARRKLQRELAAYGDDRGIDHVAVSVDQAEEYGFLLPKNPGQFLFSPQLGPNARERFVEVCRKKQFLDPARRPLLLKNPDDFYGNFLYIQQQFPAAKFMFVHRHPLMVLSSQVNAWTRMLAEKNAYFARLHPLYDALFDHPMELFKRRAVMKTTDGVRWMFSEFVNSFRYYCDHVGQFRDGAALAVRYEDLCRDPQRRFAHIAAFLGVDCRPQQFADCVRRRRSIIAPLVREVYDSMCGDVQFYLDAMGYEAEPWELTS